MPKKLTDISFVDLLPDSISGDETVKDAAESLDGEIQAVNDLLEVPALYARLDQLDERAVDLLAWQYHVDFWKPDLPLDRKRELVRRSIGWHRTKGTPWAVKKLLADTGFSDAEVIEWWQARRIYEDSGGVRLDGSWTLGGSDTRQLVPYRSITGLPYLGHWAEFCVRLNLTESRWPGWNHDLIQAVETAKPARSHPVWLYWLYLELLARPEHTYSFALTKSIPLDYPWCSPQLDGTWSLGSGGYPYELDGSLTLDGSWGLGERTATVAQEAIKQCNISCDLALRKDLVRPERHVPARLGESKLRLDGGWQVGLNRIFPLSDCGMVKSVSISAEPGLDTRQASHFTLDYPASPRNLDQRVRLSSWVRLDGSWRLSQTLHGKKLDGWPLRRMAGIDCEHILSAAISGDAGLPAGLSASMQLDGSWALGHYGPGCEAEVIIHTQ